MFRALLGSAKVRLVVTKSFQQVFRATDLLAGEQATTHCSLKKRHKDCSLNTDEKGGKSAAKSLYLYVVAFLGTFWALHGPWFVRFWVFQQRRFVGSSDRRTMWYCVDGEWTFRCQRTPSTRFAHKWY
jgi:hypothetical protein